VGLHKTERTRNEKRKANNDKPITWGDENEHFVDREYQYVSIGDSHYHGLLSYHPGECVDKVAEKRIN